jgi:hypothetical protein
MRPAGFSDAEKTGSKSLWEFPLLYALNGSAVSTMSTVGELGQEIAELAARLDGATHKLLTSVRLFDESNECFAQGGRVLCALVVLANWARLGDGARGGAGGAGGHWIVLCPDEAELVYRALDCAREVEHDVATPTRTMMTFPRKVRQAKPGQGGCHVTP